jgi:hypothetical protein
VRPRLTRGEGLTAPPRWRLCEATKSLDRETQLNPKHGASPVAEGRAARTQLPMGAGTKVPSRVLRYHRMQNDPMYQLAERLAIASDLLAGDLRALAQAARAPFAAHLPKMEPPEDEILRRYLFQREPIPRIAASLQLPQTDILGWAALALMRLIPDIPVDGLLHARTIVDRSPNLP